MPPEFSIRSDSVDVDEIMTQIRSRIREKRGVDYTEEELRQLASVKLEKFLDPTRVRSDLILHYRRMRAPGAGATAPPENYAFDDHLVYESARGASGGIITRVRRLLNPVLKLFFNPNPIIQVLNRQSAINAYNRAGSIGRRAELRVDSQPRAGGDPPQHRGEEPEDAHGIAVGAARLQRSARPGARERRAVQARHRSGGRTGRGGIRAGDRRRPCVKTGR